MAGGRGVRLQPLTFTLPKPLLPLGERPILEFILGHLRDSGFEEVILAVGYRADLFRAHFAEGSDFKLRIEYVIEDRALGTAGPLALVRSRYRFGADESLLVLNGDILTSLDLRWLTAAHASGHFDLTVAVRESHQQLPFGVVDTENGIVKAIVEKPIKSYTINGGIYVLRASVLDLLPPGAACDMPEFINLAIARGLRVGAYAFSDPWLAIEGPEQLCEAAEWISEHGSAAAKAGHDGSAHA